MDKLQAYVDSQIQWKYDPNHVYLYKEFPVPCDKCGHDIRGKVGVPLCSNCGTGYCSIVCKKNDKVAHAKVCSKAFYTVEDKVKEMMTKGMHSILEFKGVRFMPLPGPISGHVPKCLVRAQDIEGLFDYVTSGVPTPFSATWYYLVDVRNYDRVRKQLTPTQQSDLDKLFETFASLAKHATPGIAERWKEPETPAAPVVG